MELTETPDHPEGSRWVWVSDGLPDEVLRVTKVTKRTVTMRFDSGETVQFMDKDKALRSGKITRIVSCRKKLDCGAKCMLIPEHDSDCLCAGDYDGPGTCPA